jgi:hypothetical protein
MAIFAQDRPKSKTIIDMYACVGVFSMYQESPGVIRTLVELLTASAALTSL